MVRMTTSRATGSRLVLSNRPLAFRKPSRSWGDDAIRATPAGTWPRCRTVQGHPGVRPAAWDRNGWPRSRPTCGRWSRRAGSASMCPAGSAPETRARAAGATVEDRRVTTDTRGAAPEPQAVIAPLTGAAIFLVVESTPGEATAATERAVPTRGDHDQQEDR